MIGVEDVESGHSSLEVTLRYFGDISRLDHANEGRMVFFANHKF